MLGVIYVLPLSWVKLVVDSVVLPAHATTTSPLCYSVFVRITETIPNDNQSGGTGQVVFELYTDAPDEFNKVAVTSVTVTYGSIVGETTAELYGDQVLVIGWMGEAIPTTAIPLEPTTINVEWTCANGETDSLSDDFRAMVTAFEGAQLAQAEEAVVE